MVFVIFSKPSVAAFTVPLVGSSFPIVPSLQIVIKLVGNWVGIEFILEWGTVEVGTEVIAKNSI
jgi:hypothetical protein